jgi:hypothetical protein
MMDRCRRGHTGIAGAGPDRHSLQSARLQPLFSRVKDRSAQVTVSIWPFLYICLIQSVSLHVF